MRTLVIAALALLGAAAPLAAQKPAAAPAEKAVRERAVDKLRALERASRPGAPVQDSAGVAAVDPARATPIPGQRGGAPVDSASTAPPAPTSPEPSTVGQTRTATERAPVGTGEAPAAAETGIVRLPPGSAVPVIVHVPSDSFEAALRRMEGYALTEYRAAGSARYEAGAGQLELIGSPVVTRDGQSIQSDSLLVYDEPRAILCGYGNPVLQGSGNEPVESDQVCYDVDRRLGVALRARTKYGQSGGTWFVEGQQLYTRENDRIYSANATFTTCDLEEPHYHFAAKNVKIVHKEILVARDVTLRFQDVPVFWLPFLVQSMKDGRRSGLLTPQFIITDIVRNRAGYDRRISNLGFYWAISDYMDARFALDWWSDHWVALDGSFGYNWARQFLRGNVLLTRYWRTDGSRQLDLVTNHSWQPGENTTVSISGDFRSAELIEQHSFDPTQLNRTIASNASFNHRFGWGTLNIGANRTQYLTQDQTTTTFPSVTLNLTPITLFPATGEARWYNNGTWNGSVSYKATATDRDELLPGAGNRDTEDRTASISSGFTLGNVSWRQNFNFAESVRGAKPWIPDPTNPVAIADTALPLEVARSATWSTSLGYTQRLIGTSTFTPSVSLGGEIRDTDQMEPVAGPTRLTFGASLATNIFGFWPGFGPFSRLRHRIDPSISYSYSPVPKLTPRQIEVFGEQAGKPTNQLTIGFNQTWEAKYADADTVSAAPNADTTSAGVPGEPRRLPQARKIMLLSLSTNALVYDFTKAREGDYGLQTTQLSHSIRSDLLEGLSLSVGYDLFEIERAEDGGRDRRTFSPSLRTVNASFSLDSNSWLFRVLGLGRPMEEPDTAATDSTGAEGLDPMGPITRPGYSAPRSPMHTGSIGSWRANLNYSLTRPASGESNQLVRGSLSFQPTAHWNVQWQTAYSITDREFADHYLVLSRDLHRWKANFIFTKTRTGNLAFSFRVDLQDLQEIKVEYEERYESPRGGSR